MAGYFYIAVLIMIFCYTIIREILMFKKGSYNPYIYKRGKGELPFIVRLGTTIFISIGGMIFVTDKNILLVLLYVFIAYSACLVVNVSTLNCLSFLKSKDKNIIIQTVIFDIVIICVTTGIWRYVA